MANPHTTHSGVPSASAKRDPFAPLAQGTASNSLDNSSHIITLPHIPVLYNPDFLDAIIPPKHRGEKPKLAEVPSNSFMTALREDVGNRTLTDNNSPAFISTLSAPLDLFSVGPNADGPALYSLLDKSWSTDPNLTLRLIFAIRSIHDGKSEKDTFYHAIGWLFKNHPRTTISNLHLLVEPVIDRPAKKPKESKAGDVPEKVIEEQDKEDWTEVGPEEKKDIRPGFSHGYYKDLLNILTLAAADQLSDPDSDFPALYSERPSWSHDKSKSRRRAPGRSNSHTPLSSGGKGTEKRLTKREKRALRTSPPESPADKKAREAKQHHERLVKKLTSEPEFRALFVAVARIFGLKLADEITVLKKITGDNRTSLSDEEYFKLSFKIGLISKWAPTLGASHDRSTNIATAISLVLHQAGAMTELPIPFDSSKIPSEADLTKIRGFYRRWIVSPLRRHAEVPEVLMTPGLWKDIKYSRVPAVCMKNSKGLFFKHDEARFKSYLRDVTKGKRSIAGATLAPHELLQEAIHSDASDTKEEREANYEVIGAQWKSLVERLRESGALDNCLALCDVSGSMGSIHSRGSFKHVQPIFPAVALSILVAQLASPPFNNTFITFSATPEIINLDPSHSLVETANHMVSTAWGMNTDLQAVFLDLILPLAIKHDVKKEEMVKRLFIFSDMQFDDCRGSDYVYGLHGAVSAWETDHNKIVEAYTKAGYDVPEIVYWNLSSHSRASKPVTARQEGVALLSGFSGNLLKVFMEGGDELDKQLEQFQIVGHDGEDDGEATIAEGKSAMNPVDVMVKAVSKKSFDGLKVID